MKFRVALLLIVLMSGSLVQGGLQISKGGKGQVEIVLPSDGDEVLKYAASELQHHVKLISGAELPIVSRESGNAAIVLSPGNRDYASDLEAIGATDGYAIRQKGNKVYVISAISKGILTGVYRLLYRNTDLIWARPDESLGTIYTENPDLEFAQTHWLDVPKFVVRGWQMSGGKKAYASDVWQFRQGSNWAASYMRVSPDSAKFGCVKEAGGGHNLTGMYITGNKYFDKHPEYFPFFNGARQDPRKIRMRTQLCFTNNEMTEEFKRILDENVASNPGYAVYRILIEDVWQCCECPECKKPITLEDGTVVPFEHEAFRSTQFFTWLNKIAAHFRKNYPGRRILTFGYFFTETPPLIKIDPIISISFCPIRKNSKFCLNNPDNEKYHKRFLDWMKNTTQLTWREYYGLHNAFPRPIDAIAIEDYRYVNSFGVNRTYSEMTGDCDSGHWKGIISWDLNAPYFWVCANANWDPAPSVEDFRKQFFSRVYKDAADDVAEFYSIIEKDFIASPGASRYNDNALNSWRNSILVNLHEDACRNALHRAGTRGLTGKRKAMLDRLVNAFETCVMEAQIKNTYTVFPKGPETDFRDKTFSTPQWIQAVPMTDFTDANGADAPDKTLVKAFYDEKNIYFGIRTLCNDVTKLDYNKTRTGKNEPISGEGFQITLRDGVNRLAFHTFAFDPAGNCFDGTGKPITWKAETFVDKDAWAAYVTIPWKNINVSFDKAAGFAVAFTRFSKEVGKDAVSYGMGKVKRGMLMYFLDKEARKLRHIYEPMYKVADFRPEDYKAPKGPRANVVYPPFRYNVDIIIWGDKGEKIDFTLTYNQVGREKKASQDSLVLHGPGGVEVPVGRFDYDPEKMPGNASIDYSCVLPETGCYILPLDAGFNGYIFKGGKNLRWAMRGPDKSRKTVLVRPTARPVIGYFEVPKGVTEFSIEFIGGSGADVFPMPMFIKNAKGEVVKETVGFEMSTTMKVKKQAGESEIWSFEVQNARAAIYVRMGEPLRNIWASCPGNLPLLKN